MKTIKENCQATQTIQKSEFICTLYRVTNVDEANEKLAEHRKKHYDATHNCYSYIIGNDASIIKYSDDGEPSQTAGIVIYDVLKKNELTNVLAIVTRYFGGIKLGAGGLVRAYSSSTALAVKEATILAQTPCYVVEIECSYPLLNAVQSAIREVLPYYSEITSQFLDTVFLTHWVKIPDLKKLEERLIQASKGSVKIKVIEEIIKEINL